MWNTAKEFLWVCVRRLLLVGSRGWGTIKQRASHGPLPLLGWFVAVCLALVLLPPFLNQLSDWIGAAGVWSVLEVSETPQVGNWWTPGRVLLIGSIVIGLVWFIRARERVVIEEFVDYTSADAKAVKGLATLLVTELARLRDLYGRVNDELSVPTSVGVRRQGAMTGTEAGAFLSAQADAITDVLRGAVASEAKVTVGGIAIPVGALFGVIGRIARGPRVLGSVHLTEAGGGPTLTAQIVGRASNLTWRVDVADGNAPQPVSKAFLNPMIGELACRMFTDLTLRGSVRWRAIEPFTEYLRLYWDSVRTPKDRARSLKQAEGKLLESLAADERFDLAYYNLGVIYSQLAQAEAKAAELSEYIRLSPGGDPNRARHARLMAAMTAFQRALASNRERWEATYGLAVHTFTRSRHRHQQRRPGQRRERAGEMERVVSMCRRVLELDPGNALAYDLLGMAQLRLGHTRAAIRSHRRAVTRSWLRLCAAEFHERAAPPTIASPLRSARANAAAALHNLALAHAARGRQSRALFRWLRFVNADWAFHQALTLSADAERAATEFERGRMRLDWKHGRSALDCFEAALRIEGGNPIYWAWLARAQAQDESGREQALGSCRRALDLLAPIYRRTLEPYPSTYAVECRDQTLAVLGSAYSRLGERAGHRRMHDVRNLHRRLARAGIDDLRALSDECRGSAAGWEYEQVAIVLARRLGDAGDWPAAEAVYAELIGELDHGRSDGIRDHALHAKHAKALRKLGRPEDALKTAARGLLQDPLNATVRREVGSAQFELRQFEEARAAWENTLWLTPNDPYLHWRIGFCSWTLAQQRQDAVPHGEALAQAAERFQEAALLFGVENADCRAWAELWLGRVRLEQQCLDSAVEHLNMAHGAALPELATSLFLGDAYREIGDCWLSRRHYEDAKRRAQELRAAGQLDGPIDAHWGDTLTYDGLMGRAELGLAYCVAGGDGDLTRARRQLDDALTAAENIGDARARAVCMAGCLHLEADLLLQRGEVERALASSQKAASLNPCGDILLQLLRLYEAEVSNGISPLDRLAAVVSAKETVDALRRLDGDGDRTREGVAILARLEGGAQPAGRNGAALVVS